MPLILLIVFLTAFAVVVLLVMATGDKRVSQVRANLDSALDLSRFNTREEVVDVRKKKELSSIPWMQRLLEKMEAPVRLQRILDQADLKWTPMSLVLAAGLIWVIATLAVNWRTNAGALSLLIALPAAAAPFIYVWYKRSARFFAFKKALPDALDQMVNSLRAGHSLIGALGIVATESPEPIRREFRICFEEQSFGLDLREALENLMRRVPLTDLRVVVSAILIQKESGGNVAEALEKTAAVMRQRFRLLAQIRVHTAQGRLTGGILMVLPLVTGIIIYLLDPGYIKLLFTRHEGHIMIGIGVVLNIIGLFIIRRIIRIRV